MNGQDSLNILFIIALFICKSALFLFSLLLQIYLRSKLWLIFNIRVTSTTRSLFGWCWPSRRVWMWTTSPAGPTHLEKQLHRRGAHQDQRQQQHRVNTTWCNNQKDFLVYKIWKISLPWSPYPHIVTNTVFYIFIV